MSGTDPGDKSSAQIEREVEQTRNNVADTLDTLRQRLQPGQMVDQVVGQVSDYVRSSGGTEFVRNLGTSVRDNPLPVAMIGAGIAWLLMSGGSRPAPRYGYADYEEDAAPRRIGSAGRLRMGVNDALDSARQIASDAAEAAGDMASRAKAAVTDAASRAGSAVGDVVVEASSAVGGAAEQARDAASRLASTGSGMAGEATEGVRRTVRSYAGRAADYADDASDYVDDGMRRLRSQSASRSFEQIAESQPLVFGALGLALGAALGAVLPKTEAEDRLMGEARDQVASRLGETAREGLETVKGVAGEQLERVKETLADTYETTKDRLNEGGISGAGAALSSAAGDVARTAEDALRGAAGEVKRTIAETGPRQG